MANYSRTQRVADQIQKVMAGLIQSEIKDPRLGMITVTAVDISRDLTVADVYITQLVSDGIEVDKKQTVEILGRAVGFLRSRLARLVKLRLVPELRFHYDDSVENGRYLSSLIDKAVSQDQKNSKAGDN